MVKAFSLLSLLPLATLAAPTARDTTLTCVREVARPPFTAVYNGLLNFYANNTKIDASTGSVTSFNATQLGHLQTIQSCHDCGQLWGFEICDEVNNFGHILYTVDAVNFQCVTAYDPFGSFVGSALDVSDCSYNSTYPYTSGQYFSLVFGTTGEPQARLVTDSAGDTLGPSPRVINGPLFLDTGEDGEYSFFGFKA